MIDEQKEIAKHYGLEHQLLKLVEELGEAQTEVGRYLQGERADKGALVERAQRRCQPRAAGVLPARC